MNDLIRITLVRSPIGYSEKQHKVLRSLGLKKMNSFVIKKKAPEILGMVNKVNHLVKVEPVETEGAV